MLSFILSMLNVVGTVGLCVTILWGNRYMLRRIQEQDRQISILRSALLHAGRGTLVLVQQRIQELESRQ